MLFFLEVLRLIEPVPRLLEVLGLLEVLRLLGLFEVLELQFRCLSCLRYFSSA